MLDFNFFLAAALAERLLDAPDVDIKFGFDVAGRLTSARLSRVSWIFGDGLG